MSEFLARHRFRGYGLSCKRTYAKGIAKGILVSPFDIINRKNHTQKDLLIEQKDFEQITNILIKVILTASTQAAIEALKAQNINPTKEQEEQISKNIGDKIIEAVKNHSLEA